MQERPVTSMIYTDQTGAFPITSRKGARYVLIIITQRLLALQLMSNLDFKRPPNDELCAGYTHYMLPHILF